MCRAGDDDGDDDGVDDGVGVAHCRRSAVSPVQRGR